MAEQDIFDELENSTKEPAVGQSYEDWWEPDNDQLMGVLIEVHSAPEKYTDPGDIRDPVYTFVSVGRGDFEEGEAMCTKTHTQILNGLEGAEIGDLVNIKHKGLTRVEGGNAANQYEIGIIPREAWEESDQADHIEEVIENYEGATGNNRDMEPFYPSGQSGGSSQDQSSNDSSDASGYSEAVDYLEDILQMQNGRMPIENAEKMLGIRDFDVSVEELAMAAGWEIEDDELVGWD